MWLFKIRNLSADGILKLTSKCGKTVKEERFLLNKIDAASFITNWPSLRKPSHQVASTDEDGDETDAHDTNLEDVCPYHSLQSSHRGIENANSASDGNR